MSGEELAASLFGWANRTLEASADPLDVPWAWRVYAYRGYLAAADARPLAARAPPAGGAVLQPADLGARTGLLRPIRGSGTPARTASSCAANASPRKSAIEVRKVHSSMPIVPAIGP